MAASAASCDLSTGSSVYDTSEEKTNGLRLVRLLVEGGTAILRKFLYFVYPPENLQVVFKQERGKASKAKIERCNICNPMGNVIPSLR